MNTIERVAVCSRSFSTNLELRKKLLQRYENVTFNDSGARLEGGDLVDFLRGHQKAITALEKIDASILSKLPELKVISKYGVGLDMVNTQHMRDYGVRLGWVGGVNKRSVSELVISFAITLLRNVMIANTQVKNGVWQQLVGNQLTEKTIGVIGCGNVGKDLIRLLQPFDCKILVHDIQNYDEFYKTFNVKPVNLDQLLVESDIVSLHVPLDQSTQDMLKERELKLLKSNAILINLARGGLVDEEALKQLLFSGKIAGAAFDVFEHEPPIDRDLLNLPNFLATPHIGGSAAEAIFAMGLAAINGLEDNNVP